MKIPLLIIFFFVSSSAFGQSILTKKLDGSEKGISLEAYLVGLEKEHQVKFFFLSEWLNAIIIEKDYQNQTLQYLLSDLLLGSELNYIEFDEHTIVFIKDPQQAIQRTTLLNDAIQERKKIEEVKFGQTQNSFQKTKIKVSGIVKGKNGEPLIGARIYFVNLSEGITSGDQGQFQIQVPAGEHIINFSFVNYDEKVIHLKGFTDGEVLSFTIGPPI